MDCFTRRIHSVAPAIAALVKHGHDLVFQQVVDGAGVHVVLILGVRVAIADGPAPGFLIGLVEPSVQNAEIQHAVHSGLHAACAAGLFAAPRSVEPESTPCTSSRATFMS